ncbi:hypothetical protein ACQPZX_06570 [Actinoplanes sp. CA-142083]|uniref:hypothetical protein n=1 Tax=Actinoplanes sp. CA-142083 TaxID=3239903 RepID=UPI003D8DAB0E
MIFPEDAWTRGLVQATREYAGGELYAISRAAELLVVSSQPSAERRPLPPADYRRFITAIGGVVPRADAFHPFFHEIVAVEPADDPDAAPELVREWWPPCMAGSMMSLWGGVTVRGGAHHMTPAVAAGSPQRAGTGLGSPAGSRSLR